MTTWDAAERRLTNDIEANLPAYRAAASAVVRDVLGGVEVSVDVATTPRSDGSVILLSVPMGRFALRLQVDGTQARHAPRKDFASKLRQRIEEALTHADRFASRLADVRVKVEASVARNGGMRLLLLEMTASPTRSSSVATATRSRTPGRSAATGTPDIPASCRPASRCFPRRSGQRSPSGRAGTAKRTCARRFVRSGSSRTRRICDDDCW